MDPKPDAALQDSNTPGPSPVEVAAGLIFRDGRLLIAQRCPDSHLGGLWEFPGGKREADETSQAALVRELQEELGVTVVVGELIERVEHEYPDKKVRIEFFRCRLQQGEPTTLGCHALRWVRRDQLRQQQFPEADARLINRLARGDDLWNSGPQA